MHNRVPKRLEICTQIVIFLLQTQYLAVFIWRSKQIHTKKFWPTSHKKGSKELPPSSIWIGLQSLFSSQKCLAKRTVKPLKSMMEIMNYSTSMKKLNQCLMCFAVRLLNKPEWKSLKKQSLISWNHNKKSMKKLLTQSSWLLRDSRQLSKGAKKKLSAERFKTKLEKKRRRLPIKR